MLARAMTGLAAWSPALALLTGLAGPHDVAPCVVAAADAYERSRTDLELGALQRR